MCPLSSNDERRRIWHPAAVLIYVGALFFVFLSISHPFYVLTLGFILLLHFAVLGAWHQLKQSSKMGLGMIVLFMIVNVVICQSGETVLWRGPQLAGIGTLDVSVEEMVYSFVISIQILMFFNCFCLYTVLQDTDQALTFFSRFAPRSALTLTLAALLVPNLETKLAEAKEMLIARGATFSKGHWFHRLRSRSPLVKIALLSALEGSWETAEALQARGHGRGKKVFFHLLMWRQWDRLLLCLGALIWLWLIMSWISGEGKLVFYPQMESLFAFRPSFFFVLCFLFLLGPVALWWRSHESL